MGMVVSGFVGSDEADYDFLMLRSLTAESHQREWCKQ